MEQKNEVEVVHRPTDKKVGNTGQPEIKNNSEKPKVYLIYDLPDQLLVNDIKNFLTKEGIFLIEPDFEGTLIDRRTHHVNNLITADIIVIFYGRDNILWLRTKLLDILKSPGLGRNKPLPQRLVYADQHLQIAEEFVQKYQTALISKNETFPSELLNNFLNKAIKSNAAVSE